MTHQLTAVIISTALLIGGFILLYLWDQRRIARRRASLPELDLSSEFPVMVFACDRSTGAVLDESFD